MTAPTDRTISGESARVLREMCHEDLRELSRDLGDALAALWAAWGAGDLEVVIHAAVAFRACADELSALFGEWVLRCYEIIDGAK